jgi:hypothetical protein
MYIPGIHAWKPQQAAISVRINAHPVMMYHLLHCWVMRGVEELVAALGSSVRCKQRQVRHTAGGGDNQGTHCNERACNAQQPAEAALLGHGNCTLICAGLILDAWHSHL